MKLVRDSIILLVLAAMLGAFYNYFAPKPLPWFREERKLTFVDDADLFKPKTKDTTTSNPVVQYTCSNTVFIIIGVDTLQSSCKAMYTFKKVTDSKIGEKLSTISTDYTKYVQIWSIGDTLTSVTKEAFINKVPLKNPIIEVSFKNIKDKNSLDSLVKQYE